MRTSAIFGMLAVGALAKPLHHHQRRDVVVVDETDVVTDYTTVTAGSVPTSAAVVVVTTVAAAQPTADTKVQAADFREPAAPARGPAAPAAAPQHSFAPVPVSVAPSPAAPSSTAAAAPAGYASTAVSAHNTHRKYHSAGDIAWDDNLASIAQTTAQTCKFAHDVTTGKGSVNNGNGYGQNIAAGSGSAIDDVINGQWYGGEAVAFQNLGLYGNSNPVNDEFDSWGHFSQLIWNGSTTVGCYTAQCDQGVTEVSGFMNSFTVCNYAPAGNMMGSFDSNVFKPAGSAA